MEFPEDRVYAETHEWAKTEDGTVRVGISQYAVDELGDIVFIDLPQPGTNVTQGAVMGEVESVKAVAELYAPVSGTITEVHDALMDDLDLIPEDPYDAGWLVVIEPEDHGELDELLDAAAYAEHCGEE